MTRGAYEQSDPLDERFTDSELIGRRGGHRSRQSRGQAERTTRGGRLPGADRAYLARHHSRRAYIVNSLKHPAEAIRLRQIYSQGFYLLGVHCDEERRASYLEKRKRIPADKARELIRRDENERLRHGQHVSDTFHLSDFYVRLDGNGDRLESSLWRIIDILFGDPYKSPTFDEYAMFLAFVASLRSVDLSRQVGAVVARDNELLATGANDCPRTGGGLYWPQVDDKTGKIADEPMGRDYMRGADSNKIEKQLIIEEILDEAGDEQGFVAPGAE